MKTFYEMFQILQAKKLFEQDGAPAGGGDMAGMGGAGMDAGSGSAGFDFSGGDGGASAGGMKGVSGQIPADQKSTMSDLNMGDDSQLSEPVGTPSKSEQKESLSSIKGLLDDVLSAAGNNQPLDDETVQKLKQAVDKLGELHDSMEDEGEESEADQEEKGDTKPDASAGQGSEQQPDAGMDLSMDMGGNAAAPAPSAGGANTQTPSMNFGM